MPARRKARPCDTASSHCGSPGAARSARRDGRRTNAGRRRPWPSPHFVHPKSDGPHFGFREQWRRSGRALLRLVWVAPFYPSRRVARSKPTLCPSLQPVGSDPSPSQTSAVFVMAPLSLFTVAPGLPVPWEVVDVAFDPQSGRIDFHRAFAPGTRCSCPQCGAEHPPVHDKLERDWRHLNFFQFQASIHAKVPRVRCGTCARTTPRSWCPGRVPTAASAYGWRPYWSPSVRRWRSLRSLNCLVSATGASGAPSTIRRSGARSCRQATRLACVSIALGGDHLR